jgi:hypothetical protein
LDNSAEIKLDNNIVWIQVNPGDMMPQMVERNASSLLDELNHNIPVDHKNILLSPDNELQKINASEYDNENEDHTEYEGEDGE